jgi:hypothetical protein
MNQTNLNPAATTINEPALVERFNAELLARGDARQLHVDRTTRLGDFRLQAEGGQRLWLSNTQLEHAARRIGVVTPDETVAFDLHKPLRERAYAAPA